ncbi:MAG: membrane protein insertase YidC [Nitrospinaceae bacterium]
MENRLLLAFVLSLLVFFGWGYLISKIQGPPPDKPETAQKKAEPKTFLPAPDLPSGQAVLPPVSGEEHAAPVPGFRQPEVQFPGEEITVKVSNGRVTFLISNKGGVLKGILLAKYKDAKGDPIDLVHMNGGRVFPLALEADDEWVTRILQNAKYTVSADSLVLSPADPEKTLTMRLQHESGLVVVRKFTFHYDKYLFDVQTQITGTPFAGKNLSYNVLWGPGLGGAVTSQTDYIVFSGPTTFVNNERIETPPEDIEGQVRQRGEVMWTGFQNKYFAAALVPEKGTKSAVVKKDGEDVFVGLELESVQSSAFVSHKVYAGTKELMVLEEAGNQLVRLIDYGWVGNKFAFLVKPLLKSLQYFYGLIHNYGWSIIIITVIIKIIFFPLTHKSFKSMKGMQKVQPYVKIIQERHKDDRQKMNEEMLELYKKHKVNPLGGCLPMLLQIPVFIALYHALFFSIELKGAPFIGWITDLSVADPYYVTPVLMGASMYLQQKLSPAVGDPMQQKIMMMLPIFFTFLFMSFPAGLVLYWTVNNILTISQQYYIYNFTKD